MRKRKGKNIVYKKERVVLSDVLPYEVPPFFSNRNLYRFLIHNKVEIDPDYRVVKFKKDKSKTTELIIKILFGIDFRKEVKREKPQFDYLKLKSLMTIPFKFKITHKENDYRELTVIHPLNQVLFVNFYDKYKNTILYHSNLSKFSLRKPNKISTLKYYKDKTNKKRKSKNQDIEIIETTDKEYTSLKTYFSYQKYSNIFQFYESYEYQRAEKKFDKLLKFDISKCFDSIYTHTLPWALLNKKIIKDNLQHNNKNTFGHKFDEIMQKMNYNETNGIVIGPEFSRIFAELILQKIDKNVERELFAKGYKYKVDYDIYRYVDDFFVFYNDDKVISEVSSVYNIRLQEYNLYINDSKTKPYNKPIITNITIAKEKIRALVEYSMIFHLLDSESRKQIGLKFHKAKDIITNYKLILSETDTSYKDLQNYFLVIIYNNLKNIITKFQNEQKKLLNKYAKKRSIEKNIRSAINKEKLESEVETLNLESKDLEKIVKTYYNQIVTNFIEIIELTFFIYTVLPRVSYSIKVCQILYRIIDFIKNQERTRQVYLASYSNISNVEIQYIGVNFDTKHEIFKKIFDGISLIFKRSKTKDYAEVETLYLLQIVKELGNNYQFNEELINGHFRLMNKDDLKFNSNLNYFTIISILNYVQREKNFSNTRKLLRQIILEKIKSFESNKAEDVLLLIDILNCPYLAENNSQVTLFRRKILEEIKFFDPSIDVFKRNKIINKIANFTSDWFFSWKENDLGKELNTKRGHNVY